MNDPRIPNVVQQSFAFKELTGVDAWQSWTPTYSFTTATGLTVTGRFHIIGRQCFFVVKSTGTSLATTAGTSYIALPIPAVGGGTGDMQNTTTNVAVGIGVIDVTNSRFYPPTQAASGNNFTFAGWYEV